MLEAFACILPRGHARRQPAQPVPLSMIAPVGQTSAARRADFRSASAIGLLKGAATVTWNPRPMNDSPRSSPACGRHLHAGAADDAFARLEDNVRVGGVPREVTPLADKALRVHAVIGRKLAQPAGDRLAAAAAQAAPGFARRGLQRKPKLHFLEGGAPLVHRQVRHGGAGRLLDAPQEYGQLFFAQLAHEHVHRLGRADDFLPAEVLIDGRRRELAGGHCPHGEVRPGDCVAAGEDAGEVRRQRLRVGGNAPFG